MKDQFSSDMRRMHEDFKSLLEKSEARELKHRESQTTDIQTKLTAAISELKDDFEKRTTSLQATYRDEMAKSDSSFKDMISTLTQRIT